jgi:hypothetical protein
LLSNPSSVLSRSSISSITDFIHPIPTRVRWFVFSRSEDTVSELLFRIAFTSLAYDLGQSAAGLHSPPTCLINTQLAPGIVFRPILLPPSSHFRATFIPNAICTALHVHIQSSTTPVRRATPSESRERWLLRRPPLTVLLCLLQVNPPPPPRPNLR